MTVYQIVFNSADSNMRWSRVTSGRPRERAVAPMSRSAGSDGKSAGNAVARAAISGVISWMITDVRSTTERTLLSMVPGPRMRPASNSAASSHRLIDATQMPPDSTARRIAASAARESRLESIASHTHTWVSRRIMSVERPRLGLDKRSLDVSDDLHDTFQASDDVSLGFLHRDQLCHGHTLLRDDYRLAAFAHLFHDAQAMGLEFTCRDGFHNGRFQMTMVALYWSCRLLPRRPGHPPRIESFIATTIPQRIAKTNPEKLIAHGAD